MSINGIIHFPKNSVSPATITVYTDAPTKTPQYLIAVHRKCVRQETYFLSQHKSKPSLFGVPLLLGCDGRSTCQSLYEAVWNQVTRLLSPMPQSDQTNHATDCDDSLGYEFPFTLKAVLQGGQICALCHWTQFCRGCRIPCTNKELLFDFCNGGQHVMCIAIDWDPTALHLRYQSCREKLWIEHESVKICKKLHTEPIDLDYCLRAFTSEEKLETKYHCSNCKDKQPATKKLQIWRLPPILIIHLKRFDYVNSKWVKTQKVVNFPFKDFDPTAYLASVPQETILRHHQLKREREQQSDMQTHHQDCTQDSKKSHHHHHHHHHQHNNTTHSSSVQQHHNLHSTHKLVDIDEMDNCNLSFSTTQDTITSCDDDDGAKKVQQQQQQRRQRLESTSLIKTPIIDGDLRDFHEHKLLQGQDPFDLKYQLYAVVSHSGLLNGGHYISYACNPNGNWYCYNDSSCREVPSDRVDEPPSSILPPLPPAQLTMTSETKSNSSSTNSTPVGRRKNAPTNSSTPSNTAPSNEDQNSGSSSSTDSNDTRYVVNKSYLHSSSSSSSGVGSGGYSISNSSNNSNTTNNNNSSENSKKNTPQNSPLLRRINSSSSKNSTPRSSTQNLTATVINDNNKYDSQSSLNSNCTSGSCSSSSSGKCTFSNMRIPKMDTSAAYILFYERSGLDYRPYLPEVTLSMSTTTNGANQAWPEVELEEGESELRKQCSLQ